LLPEAVEGGGGGDVNLTAIEGVNVSVNTGNADAGTQRVVIATNQPSVAITGTVTANTGLSQPLTDAQLRASAVPVSGTVQIQNGVTYLDRARNVHSSTNITTGTWVVLLSSVGATAVKEIEIFDSSGETLEIGIGAAGSEVAKAYIIPGGNGRIPFQIPAGTRLSVKAVSATANSGELIVNLYG